MLFSSQKGDLFKKAGADVRYAGTEAIALVNLAPLFLFSKMTLRIGGRNDESVDNVGQTISSILHLMFSESVAKTEGLTFCWFPDSTKDANTTENLGFKARMNYLFKDPETKVVSVSLSLLNIFSASVSTTTS